jgi:hypothetical protein
VAPKADVLSSTVRIGMRLLSLLCLCVFHAQQFSFVCQSVKVCVAGQASVTCTGGISLYVLDPVH